jgi:hypothetical protein
MKIFHSLATLALISSANGAILLNDTFADDDRTNANLPDSGKWIMGGSDASASSSVVGGALVTNSSGAIALTTSFTSHTLAVGETITLSFTVTTDFKGSAAGDAFRFGLFRSGGNIPSADTTGVNGSATEFTSWRGYSHWSPYGSVTGESAGINERTTNSTTLFAGSANTLGNSAAYTANAFSNGTAYDGSISITNLGGSYAISSSLGGTSVSWTDTTPLLTSFNAVSFYVGNTPMGSNGSFTLDNVKVEVIPEPSSLLIAALMPIAFLRRRR